MASQQQGQYSSQAQHVAAAAAAAAQAQQQHYNRINAATQSQAGPGGRTEQQGSHRNSTGENNTRGGENGEGSLTGSLGMPGDNNVSEEHRKVLQWVADLMERPKREAALMELSKKREQVPELALIIWHSFGTLRKSS